MSWTEGYISEINYTCGYYAELNPTRAKLAFVNAGIDFPKVNNACELGYGLGLSINIHAATTNTNWYGNDFNASQALFAQNLATASKNNAVLTDESFYDFCKRSDLPEFDFIGMHGIWSWISNDNRKIILEFIKTKLKVGGVLYISYNTKPGWSYIEPLRKLMTYFYEEMTPKSESVTKRIDASLEFCDNFLKTSPSFIKYFPAIIQKFESIKKQDRKYLAHEYFNKDWHPMYFSEVASQLAEAKMDYVCSANFLDDIVGINVNKNQTEFLEKYENNDFKSELKDYISNQSFRKDYWVKGKKILDVKNLKKIKEKTKFVLTTDAKNFSYEIKTSSGTSSLNKNYYESVLREISDYSIFDIEELVAKLEGKDIKLSLAIVWQCVYVLCGLGYVSPVSEKNEKILNTQDLNYKLLELSLSNNEINHIASELTAGGVNVDKINKIFILGALKNHDTHEKLANYAYEELKSRGQGVKINDEILTDPKFVISELINLAIKFKQENEPLYKKLGLYM